MSFKQPHHLRTDPKLEQKVVKLIALGHRYADICIKTGVPVPTIKKIRKRNEPAILQMKHYIIKSDANIVARVHQKALRELEKRLDDAGNDGVELDTKELLSIIKEMNLQSQLTKHQPSTSTYYEPEITKALQEAIDSGDDVAIQSVLFGNR